VQSPRVAIVARHLFEAYAALLFGLAIAAVWIPPMLSARETARRTMCTNTVRQHSGSCGDIVYLDHGNVVDVWSCWACGARPDNRIYFVDVNDPESKASERVVNDGIAVLSEARERLRQYKDAFCQNRLVMAAARASAK
jgi:hypothetical protein